MKRMGMILAAGLVLIGPKAMSAVSDEEFEQLRLDLAALAARVEQLATENESLRQAGQETVVVSDVQDPVAGVEGAPSWTERISMDGDFRYRYENIDEDGEEERNRSRIRARANVRAKLPSNVEVGFGLATGGDDPVSNNQTLGAGGSSKNISLNLAYADWTATDGLHLIAGKFENPLLRVGKNPLMWDGDWTPEGLAATFERGWFFANALGTWLESDSQDSGSNFSWGGQVGAQGALGGAKLKGGVGYYAIKTKGDPTYFGDPPNPDDFFGNTAIEPGGAACGTNPGTDCVYQFDYLLTQGFAEVGFDIGGFPTVLFADYVHNSDPSDNNTAWTAGFRAGQAKDLGQVKLSYYYGKKEADGVLGLLTDSDWAGGGTDNEGHFLRAQVGLNKSWYLSLQYFINELDISTGTKTDYNRLMLDTQWKYK